MARRRRRTTTSQRIARVAAVGMPYPVRAVVGTRIGSFLLLIGLPLLLITGVLTIEWDSTGPHFRFHRERAQELRQEIRADAINTVKQYQEQYQNTTGTGVTTGTGATGTGADIFGSGSTNTQLVPAPRSVPFNPTTQGTAGSYGTPTYPTTGAPYENPRYQPQYPVNVPYSSPPTYDYGSADPTARTYSPYAPR